jgi:hypothetical protein
MAHRFSITPAFLTALATIIIRTAMASRLRAVREDAAGSPQEITAG